jgi:hypothetical protein
LIKHTPVELVGGATPPSCERYRENVSTRDMFRKTSFASRHLRCSPSSSERYPLPQGVRCCAVVPPSLLPLSAVLGATPLVDAAEILRKTSFASRHLRCFPFSCERYPDVCTAAPPPLPPSTAIGAILLVAAVALGTGVPRGVILHDAATSASRAWFVIFCSRFARRSLWSIFRCEFGESGGTSCGVRGGAPPRTQIPCSRCDHSRWFADALSFHVDSPVMGFHQYLRPVLVLT